MARGASVLLILAVAIVGQALTPSSYFTANDVDKLRALFAGVQPYGSDLESVYYSVLGISLLDEAVPNAEEACEALKSNVDTTSVDSIFYASGSAGILGGKSKVTCEIGAGDAKTVLTSAATSGESKTETIYHAIAAMTQLNLRIDSIKIGEALDEALQKDDSALSHGYGFLAASYLSGDVSRFHDLIEDVIAQADEVDEKYFQFDGGLHTTAVVIDGAYKLSATAKLKPTLSEDKVLKFANYFLSRKHAQQMRNAAAILSVSKTLTDNQYHIPIAVSLASQVSVTAQNPTVQVRVSNLLGGSLGGLTVTADTARHVGDDAVVMSKTPFVASQADGSLYELDFMSVKPAHGFYKITVNVSPSTPDKRLIGTQGAEVEIKVTTQVSIEDVEIGVADKEQAQAAKTTKLQHPNKAANVLEADNMQKVLMTFQLREQTNGEAMTAHQAFVRLTNTKSLQEIIFVAEPDATNTYKFDLDVGANAKEFGHLSGRYTLDLIVGDAVIENPLHWTVADVALTFPEGAADEEDAKASRYVIKPEIHHLFREPEKRPPTVISNLFTGLVLVPALILLILWLRLGVNLSNFPLSVSCLGFHIGLASIFGLYYMYFLQLDMFVTIRYLGILSVPTFIFGNRLLSGIAAARK